ncbi:MAG: hypothetical protein H0W48_00545 [Methylibium sp.]|nr:hypothetical protein [Methylibium sp.]
MAKTLPMQQRHWPRVRFLTRARWLDDGVSTTPATSGGGWVIRKQDVPTLPRQALNRHGFHFIDCDRVCLPMVGRARFAFHYGLIDGRIIGASDESRSSARSGQPWDDSADSASAPDLVGHEVRIQMAPHDTKAWRTVWWGQVETQEDEGFGAASLPAGRRVYHCVDGLFRTSRWRLDRHGYTATDEGGGTVQRGKMVGNPGYNVSPNRSARLAGNHGLSQWETDGANGVQADYHTWAGAGSLWTDLEALHHALCASRPVGEPLFVFDDVGDLGALALLSGTTAWPVAMGDHAHGFVSAVCRRERGKGLVFVDWDDDSSAPTAPLTVRLSIRRQNARDILWPDPTTGSGQIVSGSDDVLSVDLIGDHRRVSVSLGDKDAHHYDALETQGEPIEVLTTLAYVDAPTGSGQTQQGVSLRKGWSASEQDAFRALATSGQRIDERWRPVYQLHRLPRDWTGAAGDGNNGAAVVITRADYRCNERGLIVPPTNPPDAVPGEDVDASTRATSPALIEVMSDLPLYDGYRYDTDPPTRWDGATERGSPNRRSPLIMARISADRYANLTERSGDFALGIDTDGILVAETSDVGTGVRFFSDKALGHLVAVYPYTALTMTIGLRLPHRVRLYSGLSPASASCRRRATITLPDHHLWLAHPGAIWDIDGTTGSVSAGHPGKRQAAGASSTVPGILRDDRDALARAHAFAWSWYGSRRRTVAWSLADCGLLGTYLAHKGLLAEGGADDVEYPTLGQIVETLAANGQTYEINTPVTRIAYSHESGQTSWETDWNALEFDA